MAVTSPATATRSAPPRGEHVDAEADRHLAGRHALVGARTGQQRQLDAEPLGAKQPLVLGHEQRRVDGRRGRVCEAHC